MALATVHTWEGPLEAGSVRVSSASRMQEGWSRTARIHLHATTWESTAAVKWCLRAPHLLDGCGRLFPPVWAGFIAVPPKLERSPKSCSIDRGWISATPYLRARRQGMLEASHRRLEFYLPNWIRAASVALKDRTPSFRRGPERGLLRVLACAVSLAAATTGISSQPASAAGATFYVDCSQGNNSRSGRSPDLAWRTMTKANGAALQPGDSLLFKRGCRWQGPLNARWNGSASAPITIASYGKGALPKIENARDNIWVTGSYLVFSRLITRADPPGYDPACGNQPTGWVVGWRFLSGSHHNVVRNSKAQHLYMGVFIASGSHDNVIRNNTFTDNNVADAVNSVSGGMAVVVHGDANEIAYNHISGSDSCSQRYQRDGSAIEIFGGQNNNIHHNRAIDNNTFVELGQSRTANNTIAYNVVTSSLRISTFLVARGAQDTSWGPTTNTRAYNNSVYLSGAESFGVVCGGGCGASILTFRNNIVWSYDKIAWVDGSWAESNNVWWSPGGPRIWFTLNPTSVAADPRFVNPQAGKLRTGIGSPAIDAGTRESIDHGYNVDFGLQSVPKGGAVDIGAYETR